MFINIICYKIFFFIKFSNNLHFKNPRFSLDRDLIFRLFSRLNLVLFLLLAIFLVFRHISEWKAFTKIFILESTILGFRRVFWFLYKNFYRQTSIKFSNQLFAIGNPNEFLHFHSASMFFRGLGYARQCIPKTLTNFYLLISNFCCRADDILLISRSSKYYKTKNIKKCGFYNI